MEEIREKEIMIFTYMLAPLEDVSDNALREICFKHGADLTFTEMARLSGLVRKNKSTELKTQILNCIPTQIQLAALKEQELTAFLSTFTPVKGFAGFNLNLGCPSPDLIKQGLGCALVKRIAKVRRLVNIIKEFRYPCSIKMRLGMNLFEKQKKVYLNLIKEVDADFFVVHARQGAEHYETKADETVYTECVATGKNIIANGDVQTREKVAELKEKGLKGIMIGRAAVRNPGIFEFLKEEKQADMEMLRKEYTALAEKYFQGNTKYKHNVLHRLGKKAMKENEEHVRG